MSIIGQNILAGASGGGDYEIPYGAHGDAQANAGAMPGTVTITRTPGVAPTADGTFTISTWFKMGATPGVTGTNTGLTYLFNAGPDANSFQCYFLNGYNKQLAILGNHASEASWARYPNCVWRDTAQWYHLVMALDTTEASAANRVKVWINGTQVSNFATNTNPDNGENLFWGENAVEQSILTYSSYYGDQYMSEIISVDGQALTAGDFGTASTNGQWIPIEYKGTFGTNGFYLDWADAADMGKDASGNGNDFTVSNFNAYNRVLDSPTNNWCTPNVLTPPYGVNTYYWSGLKITTDASAYWDASPSTWEVSSGKWYFEMYKSGGTPKAGVMATRPIPNYYVTGGQNNPQDAPGGIFYQVDGDKTIDGVASAYGASWADGDLISTAVNFDDSEITFYKNGVSQGAISFAGRCATSTHFVVGFVAYNSTYYQNYGQDSSFCGQKTSGSAAASDANGYGDFYYSVPTGFLAMCQKNMPDPVITVPRDNFTIDAWTGDNSASRDITTPFQPDFVWIKRTDGTAQHMIFDAVRGVYEYLGSNTTTQETNETDTLTAFNSDGYTIGNHSHINETGETYVGWAWKLGNGTVSNTDGDITSTVSADVTAGMSILKYTGTNAAGATVGHGLGVKPEMITIKNIGTDGTNWCTWLRQLNSAAGGGAYDFSLHYNSTASQDQDGVLSAVDASTFTLTANNSTNQNAVEHVAYCYYGIDGYSAIGGYQGNNSYFGPFQWTGFRPRYVVVKSMSTAQSWIIHSVGSDTDNPMTRVMLFDTGAGQVDSDGTSGWNVDFVSNGFKIRTTTGALNTAAAYYYWFAFADLPFKYSRGVTFTNSTY